jgi:hypothetical protein
VPDDDEPDDFVWDVPDFEPDLPFDFELVEWDEWELLELAAAGTATAHASTTMASRRTRGRSIGSPCERLKVCGERG